MFKQNRYGMGRKLVKRCICYALTFAMLLSSNLTAFAVEEDGTVLTDLSSAVIELVNPEDAQIVYDGMVHEPEIKVILEGTQIENHHYKVSYNDNSAVGRASIKVAATGTEYTGEIEEPFYFQITPKPLTNLKLHPIADMTFTGTEITPEDMVSVEDDGLLLNRDSDYIIEAFEDSVNVGIAKVRIRGNGNYDNSSTKVMDAFRILPKDINSKDISVQIAEEGRNYLDGAKVKPEVLVKDKETNLELNKDYMFAYEGRNTNVNDKVTINVKGIGNYKGTNSSKGFTVLPKDFNKVLLYLDLTMGNPVYDGTAKEPGVTAIDSKGDTLIKDKDYTVTYNNNVNTGKNAEVKITGAGNYSGNTITKLFTIQPRDINDADVAVAAISDQTYSYLGCTPELSITYKGTALVRDVDYSIRFSNNKNVTGSGPKAIAEITGIGNFKFKRTKEFNIIPKNINNCSISGTYTKEYTGLEIQFTDNELVIFDGQAKLVKGLDYNLSYQNNVDVGVNTASITYTGIGNYSGSLSDTFSIKQGNIAADQVWVWGMVYNGSTNDWNIVVKNKAGATLTENVDYQITKKKIITDASEILSGNDSIRVGDGIIHIKGLGNYTAGEPSTNELELYISHNEEKSMTASDMEVSIADPLQNYIYSGQPITPEISVVDKANGKEKKLENGKDYTVAYEGDTINVTGYPVTIRVTAVKGSGYTDINRTLTYLIIPKALQKAVDENLLEIQGLGPKTYSGLRVTPDLKLIYNGLLMENKNYSLIFTNNINAGTAEVEVVGKGNFIGSTKKLFKINPLDISTVEEFKTQISAFLNDSNFQNYIYDGQTKWKAPVLDSLILKTAQGEVLSMSENTNALVSCHVKFTTPLTELNGEPDFVNAGNVTITLSGAQNFTGDISVIYNIRPIDINVGADHEVILGSIADQIYQDGADICPIPELNMKKQPLHAIFNEVDAGGKGDYILEYSNNIAPGIGSVTLNAKADGNYTGSVTKEFRILGKDFTESDFVEIESYEYEGGMEIKPEIKIAEDSKVKPEDFTVKYTNNSHIGKASILITATEGSNFKGTYILNFQIVEKSLSSLKNINVSVSDMIYTGSEVKPSGNDVIVMNGQVLLLEGQDYKITGYTKNLHVGIAEITLTGLGNYSDSLTAQFNIKQMNLSETKIEDIGVQTYNRGEIKPEAVIKNGDLILKAEEDYRVSYTNNTDIGTAIMTIDGIGDFTGTIKKEFTIAPKTIENMDFNAITEHAYTGEAITPLVTVMDGETQLLEGEYKVVYNDNTHLGTAVITITGQGNFTGEKKLNFQIKSQPIQEVDITKIEDQTFTGKAFEPVIKLSIGNRILKNHIDYTLRYQNNVNAGDAAIIVEGKGNYAGTREVKFKIAPRTVVSAVHSGLDSQIYTGYEIKPSLVMKDGDTLVVEGKDYTLKYKDNIGIGLATIIIEGIGNYCDTNEFKFEINPKLIESIQVNEIQDQIFNGSAHHPSVILKDGKSNLVLGTDYTVMYGENLHAGEGTITVNGKGIYTGTLNIKFNILPKELNECKFTSISDHTYTGTELKPEIIVKDGDTVLKLDKDYTVIYSENINVGAASAKISGIGDYKGAKAAAFIILPKELDAVPKPVIEEQTYSGTPIEPLVILKDGEQILQAEKDYTIASYENNTNAGKAKIHINGAGNYKGSTTAEFTIKSKSLEGTKVDYSPLCAYTGEEVSPAVEVKDGEKTLVQGTDYKVAYGNNKEVGTGTIKITGAGNYSGTKEYSFEIAKQKIEKVTIETPAAQTYTGSAIQPSVIVKDGSKVLSMGTDYTLSYRNNTNAGLAAIVITGYKTFEGTKEVNFTISPKSMELTDIAELKPQIYTGSEIRPDIVIKDGVTLLLQEKDYTLQYKDNTGIGTAKVTVEGIGNYSGTINLEFGIKERRIESAQVNEIKEQMFDGSAHHPSVIIKDGETNLVLDTDYTVSYGENLHAGEGVVTITGKGIYAGTATIKFTILPKDLNECKFIAIPDQTYSGAELKPEITVKDGDTALVLDKNYTLTFSENSNVGAASAKISGIGDYKGTKSAAFIILQKELDAVPKPVIEEQTYSGTPIEPLVILKDGEQILQAEKDYTIASYENNTNAGKAKIHINGAGNYKGSTTAEFTIKTKSLEGTKVDYSPLCAYTGEEVSPAVEVKDGEKTLVQGTDYKVAYSNNKEVGTGTIKITGAGNYSGTKEYSFEIAKQKIEKVTIETPAAQTYMGSAIQPSVIVKDGSKVLSMGTDYTLSYRNNTNAGLAAIVITGYKTYEGTKEISFTIVPKSIQELTVKEIALQNYTGTALRPALTVLNGTRVLKEGQDYTISYKNNIVEGNAIITITGMGNYSGVRDASFAISKQSLDKSKIDHIGVMTYTGTPLKPKLTVNNAAKVLIEGTDYTIVYKNNKDVGTAEGIVTGKGIYKGTQTIKFLIQPKSIKKLSIKNLNVQKYTGSSHTPAVILKDDKTILKKNIDYTIKYSNNKNPGTAKVTIKGMGNYTDTVEKTFLIKLVLPKLSGLKNSSNTTGSIKISWKKASPASGYDVYRRSYVNGKLGSYKKVAQTKSTSIIEKGLNSGCAYYYKIRSYVIINGKKIYGNYSSSIKTATKPAKTSTLLWAPAWRTVRISWKPVSDLTGYQVYRSTSKTGTYSRVANVGSRTTQYEDRALTGPQTYYYKVRAYKRAGYQNYYASFSSPQAISIQ